MATSIVRTESKPSQSHQWVEITSLSSFTTKWSLFSSFNSSFGNVLNILINPNKRSAKVLFCEIESAEKCCKWLRSHPILDGEQIGIDLCSELNEKCQDILHKKLDGLSKILIEKIKCCTENVEILSPLFITKFHAKILRQLSETHNKNRTIFLTDAFSIIGIDAYCFSDYFDRVNAITSNDIFYSNLVENIKLFGRYDTPIKCLNLNFFNICHNLCQDIIYIDSFNMNRNININEKIKWNDCCSDISYFYQNKRQYLSTLCMDIYNKNNKNNNKQIMLIAVKVPKHFMVSEFATKVDECQIIVFDFKYHQLMVLDFLHNINELRLLEIKCKDKKKDFGFYKSFVFERSNTKVIKAPSFKKRKLNNSINNIMNSNEKEKEIAFKVSNHLKEIGFKLFGIQHTKNFKQKLKIQIYSKQLIRQVIHNIDLKSKFKEIQNIGDFIKEENDNNITWIAPNIIGPRYLIYATSQWTILVDESQNMFYHPSFNDFYQNIIFGSNINSNQQQILKSVTIMDGFLIPTNYFNKNNKNKNNGISPLQFWILDILCYQNNTSIVLRDRFNYFQNIVASYNEKCKYLDNGPISIHSLHFEEYKNLNNLLQFIKTDEDKQCIIYQSNEDKKYSINGFVLIQNKTPCIIHDRKKYWESCVLWKCDFNVLFTQYFIHQRNQTTNTDMF